MLKEEKNYKKKKLEYRKEDKESFNKLTFYYLNL